MMSKAFLLTGKPRMGKTTAVKSIADRLGPDRCGGFYTEEIRDEHDRTGFRCVALDGGAIEIASVSSDSPIRIGRYGVDIAGFETFGLKAIRASLASKPVTVIDEIGFMQVLSEPFRRLVRETVSAGRGVILGTVSLQSHPEIDRIKCLPGVRVYTIDESNRDGIADTIAADILRTLKN